MGQNDQIVKGALLEPLFTFYRKNLNSSD